MGRHSRTPIPFFTLEFHITVDSQGQTHRTKCQNNNTCPHSRTEKYTLALRTGHELLFLGEHSGSQQLLIQGSRPYDSSSRIDTKLTASVKSVTVNQMDSATMEVDGTFGAPPVTPHHR
jgi:hypothetical protein